MNPAMYLGKPPPFRAIPERKCAFLKDVFPYLTLIIIRWWYDYLRVIINEHLDKEIMIQWEIKLMGKWTDVAKERTNSIISQMTTLPAFFWNVQHHLTHSNVWIESVWENILIGPQVYLGPLQNWIQQLSLFVVNFTKFTS